MPRLSERTKNLRIEDWGCIRHGGKILRALFEFKLLLNMSTCTSFDYEKFFFMNLIDFFKLAFGSKVTTYSEYTHSFTHSLTLVCFLRMVRFFVSTRLMLNSFQSINFLKYHSIHIAYSIIKRDNFQKLLAHTYALLKYDDEIDNERKFQCKKSD